MDLSGRMMTMVSSALVFANRLPTIGIEGALPARPCHTTGHAGPYPAVRRVERHRSDQTREAKRGEVLIGQRNFHRFGVRGRHGPWALEAVLAAHSAHTARLHNSPYPQPGSTS